MLLEGGNTMAAAITAALTAFGEIWTETVNLIKGNEVLMIYLVAGLLATAFRIFKRAKKSVR